MWNDITDLTGELLVDISRCPTELSHIAYEEYDTMWVEERSHRDYPLTQGYISTVVAPIDDHRVMDTWEDRRSPRLRRAMWRISRNMSWIDMEDICDRIEWEEVLYLERADRWERYRVFLFVILYDRSSAWYIHLDMCRIDIWEGSEGVVEGVEIDVLAEWLMDDTMFRMFEDHQLVGSIYPQWSELFEMIGLDRCDDSDIWSRDIEESRHLSGMIDTVFEDEISRIGTDQPRQCEDKYPNPEKRIATWSPTSNNSKR